MKRVLRRWGVAAAAASMLIAGSAVGTANAGIVRPIADTSIEIYVSGIDAETVSAGLTAEIFTMPGGTVDVFDTLTCAEEGYSEGPLSYATEYYCDGLPAGDYAVGIAGVPEGYEVEASCRSRGGEPERIPGESAEFTVFSDGSVYCDVYVYNPSKFNLIATVNSYDGTKLSGLAYDAYTSPGGVGSLSNCVEVLGTFKSGAALFVECDLAPGDYDLALDTIPTGLELFGSGCYEGGLLRDAIPGYVTSFTKSAEVSMGCNVSLLDPTVMQTRISTNSSDPTILEGLSVEAFTDPGGINVLGPTDCAEYEPGESGIRRRPVGAEIVIECALAPGDYQLGIDGVSDVVTSISAECYSDFEDELITDPTTIDFTKTGESTLECYVELETPPDILIDIVMTGDGPHPTDEPIIELFESGDGGALLGTFGDPAEAECEPPPLRLNLDDPEFLVKEEPFNPYDFTDCAVTAQAPGNYLIGLTDLPNGYELDGVVECEPFDQFIDFEPIPFGDGAFTHGVEFQSPPTGTHCTVPLRYVEVTVSADVVVTNDDGDGASDGSDFIVEVFAVDGETVGALIDSAVDPAPNDDSQSAEFILPIGDYTFGISGPAGYDTSIVVSVVELPAEAFPGGTGEFEAIEGEIVTASIMADDIATTTTTTTIADDSGGVTPTLPPTGPSDTNLGLILAALAMLMAGGAAVRLARREA